MKYIEVKDYPNYWVNNKGDVYSTKTKGWLKLKQHIVRGYKKVPLSKNNKYKSAMAHRLVAEAFVTNSNNKPFVNHIDGNKENNHYSNLEWVTASENVIHAFKLGLRKSCNPNAKLNENQVKMIRLMIKLGWKPKMLAEIWEISVSTIYQIKYKQHWKNIS